MNYRPVVLLRGAAYALGRRTPCECARHGSFRRKRYIMAKAIARILLGSTLAFGGAISPYAGFADDQLSAQQLHSQESGYSIAMFTPIIRNVNRNVTKVVIYCGLGTCSATQPVCCYGTYAGINNYWCCPANTKSCAAPNGCSTLPPGSPK